MDDLKANVYYYVGTWTLIVEASKWKHGFTARISYTLPERHEDTDVPTFWLLL